MADLPNKVLTAKVVTRVALLATLSVGTATLLSNCGKKDESTSATFSTVYTETLSTACIVCHEVPGSGTQNGASLNFSSKALAYSTLTTGNVTATDAVGACGTVKLVTASSPSTSYLLGTIIESYRSDNFAGVTNCTPNRHETLNLSSTQQSNLVSWVQGGAQNN
jgi:hypothetical protein